MDSREPFVRKVGARDRRRLAEAKHPGRLGVLLRLTTAPSASEEQELRQAGLEISYVVGPTVTATVSDASKIEAVASLPFVEQIELSTTLYPESRSPQGTTTR
jgi:hypothetical protein